MPRLLFDFSDPLAVSAWRGIDDRVMGGLSRSRLMHDPAGHATFAGELSLERNGGFASVRCSPGERGHAGAEAVLIEVRGAARAYKVSLFVDDAFDSVSFQAGFVPAGSGWQTLRLPLAAFRASFRGREVPDAPPLDPCRIRQLGLMTADRQAGRFALDIQRMVLA